MRILPSIFCGLAFAFVSCNVLPSAATPVPPGWVSTIVVQTAQAAQTATAAAPRLPATPTPITACMDAAVLIQDGSLEDSLSIPNGSKFTVSWQLSNTGDCAWHGYSLAFVSGERMGAPDTIPIQDTGPKSTVHVSIDLVAPTTAGSFTGIFELRDAAGKPLGIGNGQNFAVTVAVGETATPTPEVPAPPGGTFVLPVPPPDCKYVKSATYPGEIISLINKARAAASPPLPALTVNALLTKSAQAHSTDMACNNYFDHAGRDKSTIHDRVVAAGYQPKFSEEMIFCSGDPAGAFQWWMGDPPHKDVILDPRVTEIGVGYAYLPRTQCISYYTVDVANP